MIKDFQKFTKDNWNQPELTQETAELCYVASCMAGEAGEACDAVKKLTKSVAGTGKFDPNKDYKHEVMLELGDTLHYLTVLARKLGYSLEDLMVANIKKLKARELVH